MNAKQSFAVPSGAGSYAPEVLYLGAPTNDVAQAFRGNVKNFKMMIDALPATADIEVDILRIKGNPATAGDWVNISITSAVGIQAIVALLRWPGVRIRAVSGGTSGTATVGVVFE